MRLNEPFSLVRLDRNITLSSIANWCPKTQRPPRGLPWLPPPPGEVPGPPPAGRRRDFHHWGAALLPLGACLAAGALAKTFVASVTELPCLAGRAAPPNAVGPCTPWPPHVRMPEVRVPDGSAVAAAQEAGVVWVAQVWRQEDWAQPVAAAQEPEGCLGGSSLA